MHQTHKQREGAAHPVRELDMFLTRLCASVPVDLMPGSNDPSGVFFPQQVCVHTYRHTCMHLFESPFLSRYVSYMHVYIHMSLLSSAGICTYIHM
jgi:hypothetical protein